MLCILTYVLSPALTVIVALFTAIAAVDSRTSSSVKTLVAVGHRDELRADAMNQEEKYNNLYSCLVVLRAFVVRTIVL